MASLTTTQRNNMKEDKYAFPQEHKLPIENGSHVRNAIARFNQVEGVSDEEKESAWARIKKAAKKFDVTLHEASWKEVGKK